MKRVVLRHVPEAASQRLLLEKGDADIASNLPGDQIKALESNADITVSRNNTTRNLYIGLSQTVEPFTKPKVREALKYLVDYKGMTDPCCSRANSPCCSPSGRRASMPRWTRTLHL